MQVCASQRRPFHALRARYMQVWASQLSLTEAENAVLRQRLGLGETAETAAAHVAHVAHVATAPQAFTACGAVGGVVGGAAGDGIALATPPSVALPPMPSSAVCTPPPTAATTDPATTTAEQLESAHTSAAQPAPHSPSPPESSPAQVDGSSHQPGGPAVQPGQRSVQPGQPSLQLGVPSAQSSSVPRAPQPPASPSLSRLELWAADGKPTELREVSHIWATSRIRVVVPRYGDERLEGELDPN